MRRPAALLLAGIACLVLAWVYGNPPFASPDEFSHYQRAIGLGQGQLLGTVAEWPEGGLYGSGQKLEWVSQATRAIEIPGGLGTAGVNCWQSTDATAACLSSLPTQEGATIELSAVGTYPPLAYVAPGLAMRPASDPLTADYLGRLASALPVLALLGLGVFASFRSGTGGLWMLGPLVAITPMVAYIASTLSSSGLEIASGLAFAAAMVRIGTDPEPPNWVFGGAAIAGAILPLSKTSGIGWLLILALVPVALLGFRRVAATVNRARPLSWIALASCTVAIILNLVWDSAVGPDPTVSLLPDLHTVAYGFRLSFGVIQHQVGVFGYLDTYMPAGGYLVWFSMAGALLILALLVGGRRERIVLGIASAVAIALPAVLYVTIIRHTGFGPQGRHVLPVTVIVPLLAGAVVLSHRDRIGPEAPKLFAMSRSPVTRWLVGVAGLLGVLLLARSLAFVRTGYYLTAPLLVGAIVAACRSILALPRRFMSLPVLFAVGTGGMHIFAWLVNARRYAVGRGGPVIFLGHSEWAPPGGWEPWAILCAAAGLLVVAIAWSETTNGSEDGPRNDQNIVNSAGR